MFLHWKTDTGVEEWSEISGGDRTSGIQPIAALTIVSPPIEQIAPATFPTENDTVLLWTHVILFNTGR